MTGLSRRGLLTGAAGLGAAALVGSQWRRLVGADIPGRYDDSLSIAILGTNQDAAARCVNYSHDDRSSWTKGPGSTQRETMPHHDSSQRPTTQLDSSTTWGPQPASSDVERRLPAVSALRHRAEVPMIVLSLLFNVALLVVAVALLLSNQELPGYVTGVISALVLAPFATFFLIRYQYWKTISNGVEVTSKQFPQV